MRAKRGKLANRARRRGGCFASLAMTGARQPLGGDHVHSIRATIAATASSNIASVNRPVFVFKRDT
jgi:hypothetical protein